MILLWKATATSNVNAAEKFTILELILIAFLPAAWIILSFIVKRFITEGSAVIALMLNHHKDLKWVKIL